MRKYKIAQKNIKKILKKQRSTIFILFLFVALPISIYVATHSTNTQESAHTLPYSNKSPNTNNPPPSTPTPTPAASIPFYSISSQGTQSATPSPVMNISANAPVFQQQSGYGGMLKLFGNFILGK